jgi:hypothetical protein
MLKNNGIDGMKEDFQLKLKNFVKRIAKHAKWSVSFRIKNNETCETGCFAKHEISRNGQFVSRNNETRFASSFAKQKAKRVSLETLRPAMWALLSVRVPRLFSGPKILAEQYFCSILASLPDTKNNEKNFGKMSEEAFKNICYIVDFRNLYVSNIKLHSMMWHFLAPALQHQITHIINSRTTVSATISRQGIFTDASISRVRKLLKKV